MLSGSAGLGIVETRRAAQRRQLLGRQAFAAHAAQHVEFALAHEVVAPLALDHRLELGLLELQLARIVLARIELRPVGGRVGDEPDHLAEEALVLGHVWNGTSRGRRCDRVAVPAPASVAEHLLLQLAALLGLQRQRRGGPGQQARQADGLAGLVAVAVVAAVQPRQRLRDLLQQLALAVARAQLQRVLFLDGGAVGRVGHDGGVLAQVLGGLAGVGQQVVLLLLQLGAEELQLLVVHVLALGHGEQFVHGEVAAGLVLPGVGELGVDLVRGPGQCRRPRPLPAGRAWPAQSGR